jgi:sugar phosphate isomerase/epimerase
MAWLSMNEITTFRWSFAQDVENYQRAGFESIGVWRQKLSDWGEEEAIDLLAGSGLRVSNVMWAGGFTGSDGRSLEECLCDASDAIRLAAALEAGCLVIYPGGRNNHTFKHAGRLFKMALEELLPLAEAAEVPLAIEPIHAACAADWTFLTDMRSVISLIDEFRSPFLKLAYDTYHWPPEAGDRELLVDAVPYLGIVHLADRRLPPTCDQDRCPLGYGQLPLGEIIGTLLEAGYTGAFDVKLMGPEIETGDYWTLLEQSQLAFAELAVSASSRSLA